MPSLHPTNIGAEFVVKRRWLVMLLILDSDEKSTISNLGDPFSDSLVDRHVKEPMHYSLNIYYTLF